jgi:hypothetical protein
MSFRVDRPFETLHQSLASALYKDLSDIVYNLKNWEASKKQAEPVFVEKKRRPEMRDVEVDMFVQTWSDTSLGFGGVAGQAFTSAYTVVVFCLDTEQYAVYHGGQFAYIVDASKTNESFRNDLNNRCLAGRMDMGRYK